MVPAGRSRLTGQGRTVVWLSGEHDVSTEAALCLTLARAIALDSGPVICDLSEVEFMGASTVGAIMRSWQYLYRHSRSLTVRAPSPSALRVMHLCGLDAMVPDSPERPPGAPGIAGQSPVPEDRDGRSGPQTAAPALAGQSPTGRVGLPLLSERRDNPSRSACTRPPRSGTTGVALRGGP